MITSHLLNFFIILSWWNYSVAEGKLEKNEISADGNFKILSKTIAKDGSFAYVACDPKELATAVSCRIVFGELSNVNILKVKDKCNFHHMSNGNKHLDENLKMRVQLLRNTKKAVVSWSETTGVNIHQHVVFVEAPKCVIKYLDFTQDTSSVFLNNLIVYEDKFDVVTSDESKCKQDGLLQRGLSMFTKSKPKGCRVRFDENGNPTGKIEHFYPDIRRFGVTAVSETVAADGFLVYGWEKYEDKFLTMGYVSKSGIVDKRIKSDINGSEKSLTISTSNAHGKLSLCAYDLESKSTSKLQCHQYLSQDLAKMSPILKEGYANYNGIESISVLNLPGKKFVVSTVEKDSHPRNNVKYLDMMLYEKDGPIIELFKEKLDTQCEDIDLVSIENEKSICTHLLCLKEKSKNFLIIYRACVPK